MFAKKLEEAITKAAEGLPVVGRAVFEKTPAGWRPRRKCFVRGLSSGEKVVCAILLAFYFEYHGTPVEDIELPERDEWENSPVDVIWPGAYYFVRASHNLSDKASWEAIKHVLPC